MNTKKKPTERQLEALRAYLLAGTQKQAAFDLGIELQTHKNLLTGLYVALGVRGHLEAAARLGWLAVPQ